MIPTQILIHAIFHGFNMYFDGVVKWICPTPSFHISMGAQRQGCQGLKSMQKKRLLVRPPGASEAGDQNDQKCIELKVDN